MNILWWIYHKAEIVNPREGVCWDAERLHPCEPRPASVTVGDVLVVNQHDGRWPKWAEEALWFYCGGNWADALDALMDYSPNQSGD